MSDVVPVRGNFTVEPVHIVSTLQELCSEINKYNQHNDTNVSLISRMLSSRVVVCS